MMGDTDGNVVNLEERGLTYCIRVLINHPSQNLDAITRESGLTPNACEKQGDERFAPNGAKLPGVHQFSTWTYWRFIHHSRNFSRGIASLLDALAPAAASIHAVRATGGRAMLILELDGSRNIGDVIEARDLSRMVELGLDFGIELYPDGI